MSEQNLIDVSGVPNTRSDFPGLHVIPEAKI